MSWLVEHRPRRIAVFRALVLGDMLCAIPALRALRATLPDARVALVGLPSMAGFARRYPRYIDDFIPFPGAPGFPEQAERIDHLPSFLATMRGHRFDLAIQLHGSGGPANDLVRGFGAGAVAGFHQPLSLDESATGLFTDWDAAVPEVRRYLALMDRLGSAPAAVADTTLELPIAAAERDEWNGLKSLHDFDDAPIVCVHPGARWSSRRWPLERFAAVASALSRRGARIVLTGSADERELCAGLAALLRAEGVPAVDLAGRTSLGALAALLADASLLICNDTGISHVAAAVRAPSVVVASGSDVDRWAPLDTDRHRVLAHQVPCRPCMYRDCPIDHPCAKGVSVDAVVAAAVGHPQARPVLRTMAASAPDFHAA